MRGPPAPSRLLPLGPAIRDTSGACLPSALLSLSTPALGFASSGFLPCSALLHPLPSLRSSAFSPTHLPPPPHTHTHTHIPPPLPCSVCDDPVLRQAGRLHLPLLAALLHLHHRGRRQGPHTLGEHGPPPTAVGACVCELWRRRWRRMWRRRVEPSAQASRCLSRHLRRRQHVQINALPPFTLSLSLSLTHTHTHTHIRALSPCRRRATCPSCLMWGACWGALSPAGCQVSSPGVAVGAVCQCWRQQSCWARPCCHA